jgi:hypothetical protein
MIHNQSTSSIPPPSYLFSSGGFSSSGGAYGIGMDYYPDIFSGNP